VGTLLKRRLARRGQRGATAVEFALVLPIFLWVVFGLIQYGFYFFAMQSGTSAVGEVTRRMTVGDCQSTGEVRSLVYGRLGAATTATSSAGITVTPTYTKADGTTSAASPGEIGGTVTLSATFPTVNLHFPLIPLPNSGNVTRTATGRIEDVSAITGGCS
jgi:Flp pilus assembly protein TadG